MWTNKYVGEGAYKNFRKKKPSQIFEFTITWNGIVLLIRIFKKKEEEIFSSTGSQYQTG